MKFFIQTFGCQMNVADSQEMSDHLLAEGLTPANNQNDADIVVLNTCTVRQHAEQKALSYLGRLKSWKKSDKKRKIIFAGCAAERLKKTLKGRFPHVDLVTGAKSIDQFPQLVKTLFADKKQNPRFDWFKESESSFTAEDSRLKGEPLVLGEQERCAFVTIMRGCNYSCSYCVVPQVRGREIYRDKEIILNEIKKKIKRGASEVMLLGQTVNSYWHRPGENQKLIDFSDLLSEVEKIEGVKSIRFMSPHPHYMTEKLISTISQSRKVSREIHLPVQSGSSQILKRMKRNYSREDYLLLSQKMKRAIPNLKLSTDFIVGFPGETEEDFEQTLSLADEINFSLAYCFKYSPRPGTESCDFLNDVPDSVKESRLATLLQKLELKKPCSAS